MPHDKNGKLIQVGDRIFIPCKVKSITMDANYCNLTVTTLDPMPPYTDCQDITLNTKQVIKQE